MRIKELRTEKNMTQNEIATVLGISRQVFANYEKEINYPDPKMLVKLADFFDVSIDFLVGRTDELDIVRQKSTISPSELEFLARFRQLDKNAQNKVLGYVDALSS